MLENGRYNVARAAATAAAAAASAGEYDADKHRAGNALLAVLCFC